MSTHFTKSIRPSTGGLRKFAVTSKDPVCRADWSPNSDIPHQADQTWEFAAHQRIAGRGYVVVLDGDGQWSNRGDHGRYLGVGPTVESALDAAWSMTCDEGGDVDYWEIPRDLRAAARDYDATVNEVEIE